MVASTSNAIHYQNSESAYNLLNYSAIRRHFHPLALEANEQKVPLG
jgi:hypothetical protein